MCRQSEKHERSTVDSNSDSTQQPPKISPRKAAIFRRLAFIEGGAKCAFPDCETRTWEDPSISFLEIAHINAYNPRGPRFDPGRKVADWDKENLIVVCPNHHKIIDSDPETYTAKALRDLRDSQVRQVLEELEKPEKSGTSQTAVGPLAVALDSWDRLEHENKEEYWQDLISQTPSCLLPLLGGRAYELRGKCYVGGKSFNNKGGNVLDFLAVHPGNSACIEIKTPGTLLMSKRNQYRNNVYLPSDELVGACVQVLESRRRLIENLISLNHEVEEVFRVSAPSPACYVIIGNLETEKLKASQRTSFELFRSSLRDVNVVTFDELFNGLKSLIEAMLKTKE
jgi:antiviral defense system Shedu protein SduA